MAQEQSAVRRFLFLAFGLGWGIQFVLWPLGVSFAARAELSMFAPAIAAVIVGRPVFRRGRAGSELGLQLPARARWWLAGYLLPLCLLAAGALVALATGLQRFAIVSNARELLPYYPSRFVYAAVQGTSFDQVVRDSFRTSAIWSLTIGILIHVPFVLGEQLGWMGYLLKRLKTVGVLRSALLTGVIWAIWRLPLVALAGYVFPGQPSILRAEPAIAAVPVVFLSTLAWSVILAWMRVRSASVWPGILAGAAVNAQSLIVILALSNGHLLLGAPIGLAALLPPAALAAWLVATGRLDTQFVEDSEPVPVDRFFDWAPQPYRDLGRTEG